MGGAGAGAGVGGGAAEAEDLVSQLQAQTGVLVRLMGDQIGAMLELAPPLEGGPGAGGLGGGPGAGPSSSGGGGAATKALAVKGEGAGDSDFSVEEQAQRMAREFMAQARALDVLVDCLPDAGLGGEAEQMARLAELQETSQRQRDELDALMREVVGRVERADVAEDALFHELWRIRCARNRDAGDARPRGFLHPPEFVLESGYLAQTDAQRAMDPAGAEVDARGNVLPPKALGGEDEEDIEVLRKLIAEGKGPVGNMPKHVLESLRRAWG